MTTLKTLDDFIATLMGLYSESYADKELWYDTNKAVLSILKNQDIDYNQLLHLVLWENPYHKSAPSLNFILNLSKRAHRPKTQDGLVSVCVIDDFGNIKEYAYPKSLESQYLPSVKKYQHWWFGTSWDCPSEYKKYKKKEAECLEN